MTSLLLQPVWFKKKSGETAVSSQLLKSAITLIAPHRHLRRLLGRPKNKDVGRQGRKSEAAERPVDGYPRAAR